MPPPAESKFTDALGILRLAHKYDIPYLRRRALEHLEPIYPARLTKYDSRDSDPDVTLDYESSIQALALVEVASEVDVPWLLPVAYYNICRWDLATITASRLWLALGEKQRRVCLVGSQRQMRQYPKIVHFLSVSKDRNDEDCLDWAECNRIRLTFLQLGPQLCPYMNWPLEIWSGGPLWAALAGMGLCEPCTTEAKARHAAARQECWDELPRMFDLPGWDELEQMRRAAVPS
ncbi:hypothetical protein B0H14DRAFT_1614643 [Mycena olivaceomarginata]|nr:hypothetical protein B0H14DRAFT_1614643 [Mycena olivaceomarginata]